MHFVLVHGWGFHAGLWNGVVERLPGADISLVDLGFIAGGPDGADDWPQDAIAVGHSLGLLWLLKRGRRRFRALVSIQGFDCFCCHVERARVAVMRQGVEGDADATLRAFWRACGTKPFAPPDALKLEALDRGLGWLMDWDAREEKQSLHCPVLALASRDDAIVPPAMTEAMWGGARTDGAANDIIWSPQGGHVLPLERPDWCASHVLAFANALQA